MRLGGRAQAAIEILDDIGNRNRPVTDVLKDWGISHRFAGSGDRSAIGNIVYDTLRKKASQSWRMNDETSPALVIATLLGQWDMTPEEIADDFRDDKFAPELPLEVFGNTYLGHDLDDAPDFIQADIPEIAVGEFVIAFGKDWVSEGKGLAEQPPLDLRVNTLKADRDKVLKRLARFSAKPCAIAPEGIRIEPLPRGKRLPNVQAEAGYQKGWFEIQDQGSQIAALLSGAKPGDQVMDFCAGGGGKTLALSALMQNRGQIHAHDSDRRRLAPIHERLKRAGARNVQVHRPAQVPADLENRMDCVMVDAPCTGSGTWRRRPDAKWRLSENNIAQRRQEQADILTDAARYVRPGGHLVYITCSLFPAENINQINGFLTGNDKFFLRPVDAIEAELKQLSNFAHFPLKDRAMVQITPALTKTDAFFIALLEKRRD
ncbi:MAG: RsmB/NOP family class I SAM-dependent RNA methyltransferase [Pseudomonadota bacterium]